MSADRMIEFTRDNLDIYLKAAAKEYRKLAGKEVPAELILVGGASVFLIITKYIQILSRFALFRQNILLR